MPRTPQGTLWVCQTCTFAQQYAEHDDTATHEPWSREPDTDVTIGLTDDEHSCEYPPDCPYDCERASFKDSACDACGDPLAGDRYAFTWWEDSAESQA